MSGAGKSDTHGYYRKQPLGEAALNLKNVSLRTALMISLMGMMVLPAVGTALFALPTFSSSLADEALKSVTINGRVAKAKGVNKGIEFENVGG